MLVANRRLATPLNNPHVSTVWVQGGPDVADRHIIEQSESGDIAITADIPLAAELVAKYTLDLFLAALMEANTVDAKRPKNEQSFSNRTAGTLQLLAKRLRTRSE